MYRVYVFCYSSLGLEFRIYSLVWFIFGYFFYLREGVGFRRVGAGSRGLGSVFGERWFLVFILLVYLWG